MPDYRGKWILAGQVLGWLLLAAWGAVWICGWQEFRLVLPHTWIPVWRFLGLDFLHNYFAVETLWAGRNPYVAGFGDFRGVYSYPPIYLSLFLWCGLLDAHQAVGIWTLLFVLVMVWAVQACQRVRCELGLTRFPMVLLAALVLWSMPVMFAMERGGGGDGPLLVLILATVWALRRPQSIWFDVAIGVCLGLGAWVRIYTVALIPGLLVLRRRRAFAAAVLSAAAFGLVPWTFTMQWVHGIQHNPTQLGQRSRELGRIVAWLTDQPGSAPVIQVPPDWFDHSLSTYWPHFWHMVGVGWLERMPGTLGAAVILLALLGWVSYPLYRLGHSAGLAWPYLLLVETLATFWMPLSYDYGLCVFVLAAIAVWDRRDSIFSHLGTGLMLLWWQPFMLPLPASSGGLLLLGLKLAGVVGVGLSFRRRVSEAAHAAVGEPVPATTLAPYRSLWREAGPIFAAITAIGLVAVIVTAITGVAPLHQGTVSMNFGRETLAIVQYNQAVARNPHSAKALAARGSAYAQIHRPGEAIDDLTAAVKIKPDFTEARRMLAAVFAASGRIPDAIEQYEQALRLDPNDAETEMNLGRVMLNAGRWRDALAHFDVAWRLAPDNPGICVDFALVLARLQPTQGGDPMRALDLAQRACQLTANREAVCVDAVAVAYASAGRYDQAIDAAEKALALARNSGQDALAADIAGQLQSYRNRRSSSEPGSLR